MKGLVFVFALAVVLITSGTAFALSAEDFGGALKIGVDFASEWEIDTALGGGDADTDTGVSICAEGYYHISEYFDAGAGIQYMFEREIEGSPGAEFWFLPLYGLVRVHPAMSDYTPYGIAQLGYAFHDGNDVYSGGIDTSGGLYWGLGVGFIYKRHFLAEILYSESNGELENVPLIGDIDVTHSRWTFSLGYNF